jgi:hypothetical protein
MERVTRGRAPGREFDIEFWQALGPSRILEAAWDLAITAASRKGIHEDQLRLQRSVEKLERGRRALPDRGRLRRERRLVVDFDGEPAAVLSREDLIESKKVTDRARDRKHARSLRKPRKGK